MGTNRRPTLNALDDFDLNSDSFTYDPNTGRMTQYKYKYTVGATPQSVVGNLTWNANGSLGKLAITDPFNSANTQTCTYGHDDLARIASGNCGSVWSQTFTYDAFGNITKSGSNQFQPGYNLATNRMSTGASYDSNGDVLGDGLHSYAWDAETRPTTIDTVGVTYDALERMVEQSKGGVYTQIVYSPTGFQMELRNGQTVTKSFLPMPGGTEEVWQASGASPYYRHSDWLGGSRFASTSTRTMYNDLAYAPFGEQYAQSGSTGVTDTPFAGNNENTVANLYDAQFREYGIQGRWPSPDPAGLAAVDPANPQSWNRYAYALNNPLSVIDPTGLWCVWQDGSHDADPEDGGDGVDQCLQDGGMWDPSDTLIGCDSNWTCTPGDGGSPITNACPPDSFSCVSGGTSSVVVNGGGPDTGGYGTGLPPGGCASYYQDGVFLGTSCGNGPLQNTPNSQQLGGAVAQGTQLAGHAIPAICGGGLFAFGGPGGVGSCLSSTVAKDSASTDMGKGRIQQMAQVAVLFRMERTGSILSSLSPHRRPQE